MDPKNLVREVLEVHAPEEVFLLDDYSPGATSRGATSRGPLGFGIESPGSLLLPLLYVVFESFLKDLGKQAGTELVELIKRLARKDEGVTVPDVEKPKEKAKALIVAEFAKAGLAPDRSEEIADKVIAVMVEHAT